MAVVVTLAKILMTVGLALTMSTSARAVVSVGLEQVGGTYDPTVGAHAGDTLILDITYSFEPGDGVFLIDPVIVWDGAVSSFDAAESTETGFAVWSGGAITMQPIRTGDIGLLPLGLGFPENLANGWEKMGPFGGAASTPCILGACSSMGTAAFVLSGAGGVISIGGIGQTGGTVIGDGAYNDIAPISNLGSFRIIPNPEPSTAALLALGLVGIAAVRRRRSAQQRATADRLESRVSLAQCHTRASWWSASACSGERDSGSAGTALGQIETTAASLIDDGYTRESTQLFLRPEDFAGQIDQFEV